MTPEDVVKTLHIACERATQNGCETFKGISRYTFHVSDVVGGRWALCASDGHSAGGVHVGIYEIIFTQDFAEKLWGKTTRYLEYRGSGFDSIRDKVALDGSEYHLQQMVVAGDPLQYLKENLPI